MTFESLQSNPEPEPKEPLNKMEKSEEKINNQEQIIEIDLTQKTIKKWRDEISIAEIIKAEASKITDPEKKDKLKKELNLNPDEIYASGIIGSLSEIDFEIWKKEGFLENLGKIENNDIRQITAGAVCLELEKRGTSFSSEIKPIIEKYISQPEKSLFLLQKLFSENISQEQLNRIKNSFEEVKHLWEKSPIEPEQTTQPSPPEQPPSEQPPGEQPPGEQPPEGPEGAEETPPLATPDRRKKWFKNAWEKAKGIFGSSLKGTFSFFLLGSVFIGLGALWLIKEILKYDITKELKSK